jgi:energy-coupling factor transporter ATP-binding protein EcfA2
MPRRVLEDASTQPSRNQPPAEDTRPIVGGRARRMNATVGHAGAERVLPSSAEKRSALTAAEADDDLAVLAALSHSRVAASAPHRTELDAFGNGEGFVKFGGDDSDSSSDSASAPASSTSADDGHEVDLLNRRDALHSRSGSDSRASTPSAEPEAATAQTAEPNAQQQQWRRQQLHGVTYDHRESLGFAPATVVLLTRPLTVRGPCVVWPLVGAVSIAGAVTFPDSRHCPFVEIPGFDAERPADYVSIVPLHQKSYVSARKADASLEKRRLGAVEHVEQALVDGKVDWAWVSRVVSEWRERMGTMPTTVLLLGVSTNGVDARKVTVRRMRHGNRGGMGRLEDKAIPAVFARTEAPVIAGGLLTGPLPAMLRERAPVVVVVGQQGVGKSTVCRHLANAFCSKHGSCIFVDLDPGQGELTPPGCLAAARLESIAVSSRSGALATAAAQGRMLGCVFTGAATLDDPFSDGTAIQRICEIAMRAAAAEGLPVVVNTHGWIHGVGKRATIQAIQVLRPGHIVHMQLASDADWVTAMASGGGVTDSASALDSQAVATAFSKGSYLKSLFDRPGTGDARKVRSFSFSLHQVAVSQQFDKGAHKVSLRHNRWRRYFGLPLSSDGDAKFVPHAWPTTRVFVPSPRDGDTHVSLHTVRVSVNRLRFVDSTGNDVPPEERNRVNNCFVGLATSSQFVETRTVNAFGLVSGFEQPDGSVGPTVGGILCIKTPVSASVLRDMQCDVIVVGRQYAPQDMAGLW